jgi:hypothetical protein
MAVISFIHLLMPEQAIFYCGSYYSQNGFTLHKATVTALFANVS